MASVGKTSEHGAQEGGDRVHPEIVAELLVYEAGVGNAVAELDDFKNSLGDANCGVKAGASL